MKWMFSIRTKIFGLVFLSSITLVAILYWQVGSKADNVAQASVVRSLEQSNSILETRIDSRFLFIREVVKGFASDGRLRPLVYEQDSITLQDLSTEYQSVYGFDMLFFLDEQGTVLARSDNPNAIGANLANRSSLFSDALSGVTATGFISSQGKLMQIVAAPIKDNVAKDLVKGAVVLAYALSPQMAQEIASLTQSHVGFFVFTRNERLEITGVEKSYMTDQALSDELSVFFASDPDVIEQLQSMGDKPLKKRFNLDDGQVKHVIFRLIQSKDSAPMGLVVAMRAEAALKQPFDDIQQQLLMSGGIGLVLASLFAGLMAIGISHPVLRLVEVVKQIQAGNYPGEDEHSRSNDEVGQLHNATLQMARSLKEKADLESFLAELTDEVNDDSSLQLTPQIKDFESKTALDDETLLLQSSPQSPEFTSKIIDQRYELISELGSGAMGTVYLALDTELNEKIALKVMSKDTFSHLENFNFKEEIRLARKITHRNILRTFDFGTVQDLTYITMEYVQGYDLGRLLKKKGALDVNVGLAVCKQICSAMMSAHQMGIIHRDLKPSNMIINRQGILKIMDFGLAMQVSTQGQSESPSQIMGTPRFMAPEQFSLKGEFDERTDIYSIGLIMFTVFNGAPPFSANTLPELAEMHRSAPVPAIVGKNQNLPPGILAVLHKALAKKPEDRHKSVRDMFELLNA